MKKQIIKSVRIFTLICAFTFLAACFAPLGHEGQKNSRGKPGTGAISVRFADSGSRSVLNPGPEELEYKLIFSSPEYENIEENAQWGETLTVWVEPGIWSVSISAYDPAYPSELKAVGEIYNIEVESGATSEAEVKMAVYSEVSTWDELEEAITAGDYDEFIVISASMAFNEENRNIRINKGKKITLAAGINIYMGSYGFSGTMFSIENNSHLILGSPVYNGEIRWIGNEERNETTVFASVNSDSSLTMNNGIVQNFFSNDDNGVINNAGTFTLNGGTISNNLIESSSGSINNSGTFIMNGGRIINNESGDFYNDVSGTGGGVNNTGTFTMNNGTIANNETYGYGGGVHNTGTFTLNSGTIAWNCATLGIGAGVYNEGTFTMSGGSIENNGTNGWWSYSSKGAGVFNDGNFTMSNGSISNNISISHNGGGVYNTNKGNFTLSGGTISDNSVSADFSEITGEGGEGGGVYNEGTFKMTGGTIARNSAENYGGGVHNTGTFTLDEGTISANESYSGGGIFNAKTFTLSAGAISANTSEKDGSGVYNDSTGTFTMEGGEITENCSDEYQNPGAGLYNSGNFVMKDGIIKRNYIPSREGYAPAPPAAPLEGETTPEEHGDGSGVYNEGNFSISGNALIEGNNRVYMAGDDTTITISGTLTQSKAANIVLEQNFARGRTILKGDAAAIAASASKFTLSSVDAPWTARLDMWINSTGKLTSGYAIKDHRVLDEEQYYNLTGIALDQNKNIYTTDTDNNRILKIDVNGNISIVAGNGTMGYADGPGDSAQFAYPVGLALDSAGNIYVADTQNQAIRKILTDGTVSTLAGGGPEAGYTNGPGALAQFNYPRGIALDSAGNIYVADTENNSIRKIEAGGTVSTFAGNTNGTYGFSNGQGTAARFFWPTDIAIDRAGNIYVADTQNHAIRKISPSAYVTTIAGGFSVDWVDGPASQARFVSPVNIAADNSGNIYVMDEIYLYSPTVAIRKIDPSGNVTTIAGSCPAGDDASIDIVCGDFFGMGKLTVDSSGTIYTTHNRWEWDPETYLSLVLGVIRTIAPIQQ